LEQRKYIISQVTLAQAILASMVGPKGCKSKRWKIKKVDTNVNNFFIGAHGSSMQTRVLS
jgi:flagellum-specific peptidoglycan hydrolase FlgJ